MKKLKSTVFQNMRIKRVVPGFSLKSLGTILLLPFLITFVLGNSHLPETRTVISSNLDSQLTRSLYSVINKTAVGKETIPLEIYVADKLARSIHTDFEPEALKAQAVLIRSNLLTGRGDHREIYVEDPLYGSVHIPEHIWQATAQTAGVCVTVRGQIVRMPYFAVSNGATRNGEELQLEGCDYLKSVLCSRDFLAEDYSHCISYDGEEFKKIWEKAKSSLRRADQVEISETTTRQATATEETFYLYRDSVGYVLYVENQGNYLSGEEFRKIFDLPSGCFWLEQEGRTIRVLVKGVGHGFGMSQYGANELAKQEKDYIEIIETFFHDVTITKFE